MGDYTSCYVGLARGVDPTPVDAIVRLKRFLDEVAGSMSTQGLPGPGDDLAGTRPRRSCGASTDLAPRVGDRPGLRARSGARR